MCCFRPSSIAAFITDINSVRSGTADVPPVQNTVDSGFSVGRCELHILSVVDHIKVLPRDAMRKRGTCCRPCLSVRLSHACIESKRLKISSNFFLCHVALYFRYWVQAPLPKFKGIPVNGGVNYTEERKICDSRLKSPLSRKRYKIRQWLLWRTLMASHR